MTLSFEDYPRLGSHRSRRSFLRVGGLAGSLACLPDLMRSAAASSGRSLLRDRSVIFLFMHGGPSQFETFDPKDDGPAHARSLTGRIATSIPGVSFGATFQQLAKRAHLLSVVRSFVTGDGNHDIKPVVGKATLDGNLGSLYSRIAGVVRSATGMPTNVALFPQAVLPSAQPTIEQFGDFTSAGELGAGYAPVVPGGDGGFQDDMRLHLPQSRLADRRALLATVDRGRRWLDDALVRDANSSQGLAFDLLLQGVSEAFDLDQEDPATVARYDTAPHFSPERISKKWNNHKNYADHGQTLGRLLLLARRLCERGCGFVTVTTSFVWDMHADVNNATIEEGMGYVGAPFDHAVSALIDDIEDRGLRDKILLVCCGEMGRTPVINKNGGRDHWGSLAPLLLYGGGLGRGSVIGRSSRDGGQPASDAVTIPDLVATILNALVDPAEVRLIDGLPRKMQDVLTRGRPIT
jgi:uncharacterized protein (DUF1501 family)